MGNASLDNGGLHAAVEDNFPGPAVVGFEMTEGQKTPTLYDFARVQTEGEVVAILVATHTGGPQDMLAACPVPVQTWLLAVPGRLQRHYIANRAQAALCLAVAAALNP